jgi:hypothetical protein
VNLKQWLVYDGAGTLVLVVHAASAPDALDHSPTTDDDWFAVPGGFNVVHTVDLS